MLVKILFCEKLVENISKPSCPDYKCALKPHKIGKEKAGHRRGFVNHGAFRAALTVVL